MYPILLVEDSVPERVDLFDLLMLLMLIARFKKTPSGWGVLSLGRQFGAKHPMGQERAQADDVADDQRESDDDGSDDQSRCRLDHRHGIVLKDGKEP